MQEPALAGLFALQGVIAGASEQLLAIGSIAHSKRSKSRGGPAASPGLAGLLTSPAFVAGQLGILVATAQYNWLLPLWTMAKADPISKVFFLLSSTTIELARGGHYRYSLLVPGLALLIAGAVLCSL